MKKLFVVLFCSFVMSGYVFADELSYEIDPVATAKAPWKVGEIIIEKGNCWGHKYYRKFLGVTQSGLALVQDFYLSNEKLTDPYLMSVTTIGKTNPNLCWDVIDGNYTVWYENGQKEMERYFKNGKLEGHETVWHENGQKQIECNYKNDKLEGFETWWYKNGQKEMERNFKNGNLEGIWTQWHENGQKALVGNLKNGKEFGIWRAWDDKGNLIEERDFGTPTD